MIISKISSKKNAKLIAEKYVEIMNSGTSASSILILTSNSTSKKNIIKNILNLTKDNIFFDMKIYTFNGLIYNTVIDNWGYIENNLKDNNTKILPNLSGLEFSQYLLKQIIKDMEVKGYNSKKSLLHQIFRRYSLIVNNNLTENEINEKSRILNESFSDDASKIIREFKQKTLSLRTFDYLRQGQIFAYIFKQTNYFKKIKYLILEDGDECSPLMIDFIKSIAPNLVDQYIITDPKGGSRCGYLCADMNATEQFKNIFNEDIKETLTEKEEVTALVDNILNDNENKIKHMTVKSLSKRLDMMDCALKIIKDLLDKGVKPSDISVITPVQDKMLKFSFSEKLMNPVFISGNEKLSENKLVKAIITVLKLSSGKIIDEYELRVILSNYLNIPVKNCKNIFSEYSKTGRLEPQDLGIYTDKYKGLCKLINKLKSSKSPLSEKAYYIYTTLITNADKIELGKFSFFLKELQDFEKALSSTEIEAKEDEIITQLENSIISENPYSSLETGEDDLIISTPQKIIDNKIETKYQIWLDISSIDWVKSDIGPLYNSWVFQKSWCHDQYTIEDNIRLTKEKTAKILRKLMNNTQNIIALSSLFDTQGVENFGGIEKYLVSEKKSAGKASKTGYNIVPRDDQMPVLKYKTGKMSISAVPGAGKTTILLELTLKLLNKKINPENIFVLTYMDSAARNFKDKIKKINPDSSKLPNISTIHGLALRILKENSNFERLGLNPDFEICDDTQRGRIIKLLSKNLKKTDLEDFDRAISVLKLSSVTLNPDDNPANLMKHIKGNVDKTKLSRFLNFFFSYQKLLKENNLIDYDDILVLSTKLLEENDDILEYYQDICEYIIEDEAQDSSSIQQKLINHLAGKHKNLIRCGDINQAITTTFTNADTEGFKNFIKNTQRVNMDCSQRCSEGVWKLANSLIKYGNNNGFEPFFEIFMKPVEDKNPIEKSPVITNIYKTEKEEKIETVKIIKSLLKQNPNCTIGILLRNNYQVNSWASYINNSGLSAITRNECLAQKTIFRVIFSILKFISSPFDNKLCAEAYRSLSEQGLFKLHLDKIIENYEGDFISQDNDNIQDADLSRFHWDMNYWLSFADLSIEELVLKIGLNYFSQDIEKSNIYLISTLCAKLSSEGFTRTIQRLDDLSSRPTLSGFKFFSENEEDDKTNGKIQVMTLHKSKGDEFDYVFLPEMNEKNLTLKPDTLTLKKSSNFMENVRGLDKNYTPKTEDELREFIISENYRLLYVAITRAKRRLYFSTSEFTHYFEKSVRNKHNIIFDELL